jgi:hypothetical protein
VRLPWRPADLPEGVCFIGVSFHHLKKRGRHLVSASVAQAFSSDHEPFCLKGAHIDQDQRRDCQPYLNKTQAFAMMRDILYGYELRTGVKPKRVVVHKTSMYQPEEEEGFREGAKGIVPSLIRISSDARTRTLKLFACEQERKAFVAGWAGKSFWVSW